mmetsp:Transcript_482/g.1260  ORF Transcript_482/g.1260 Transcript_482/m.1260 type:complete len:527 (-) Transcript_482:25-1605(-)
MSIIPVPISQEAMPGRFTLPSTVVITYASERCAGVAEFAAARLRERYGRTATAQGTLLEGEGLGALHLVCEPADSLAALPHSDEAYELLVAPGSCVLRALEPHGLFNALQSLLLLLPPRQPPEGQDISIPGTKVLDGPRFQWRGALLDVGRHFFSVEFVKKFIDSLAMHKINVFHWHLTEDQGWRVEVNQLKRLTEVSAWRTSDGGRSWYGGFYTQDEMREIVAYAQERFIHVMPEIEMPGHCCASLAAYPQLCCSGQMSQVPTQWGVMETVYCAGNDEVFQFLETVLNEIIDIFPFGYIHIGGDEVPKTQWKQCEKCQERMRQEGLENEGELQSWFLARMNRFLVSKGRKLVGWDEILEGGLVPGATVMSWRGVRGGILAAKMGHDVVMTPTSHCYFDYRQSANPQEPGCWYAMLPIENVYDFDPIPETSSHGDEWSLAEEEQAHILGGQANVWTEYISDEVTVEYMLLLRLCALAEAVWSRKDRKNWDDFRTRLTDHVKHLDAMGMRYRRLDDEADDVDAMSGE